MRGALVAAYLWNAPEARAAAESTLSDELGSRIDAIRSMVAEGLPELRPDQLRHEAEYESGLLVVTFYGVLDEPPASPEAFELAYDVLQGAVRRSVDELTSQRTQAGAGEGETDVTSLKHLASVRISYRRDSWRGDLRVQFAAQPAVVTVTVIEVLG